MAGWYNQPTETGTDWILMGANPVAPGHYTVNKHEDNVSPKAPSPYPPIGWERGKTPFSYLFECGSGVGSFPALASNPRMLKHVVSTFARPMALPFPS